MCEKNKCALNNFFAQQLILFENVKNVKGVLAACRKPTTQLADSTSSCLPLKPSLSEELILSPSAPIKAILYQFVKQDCIVKRNDWMKNIWWFWERRGKKSLISSITLSLFSIEEEFSNWENVDYAKHPGSRERTMCLISLIKKLKPSLIGIGFSGDGTNLIWTAGSRDLLSNSFSSRWPFATN